MDWDEFFTELGHFLSDYQVLLKLIAIVVGALLLRWLLQFVVRRTSNRIVTGLKRSQNVTDTQALFASPLKAVRVVQRTRTIGSVLNNIVTWVIAVVAFAMVLDTVGIGVAAIVASAGVVAAGLAFGAQSLVKDVLSGLFMVMEDQLGVGDIVDLGSASGVVENVGIRVTQVRDVVGTLWFVRNGEILRVGNMSQGWARAIIDLPIPYSSDVEAVKDTMLHTANTLVTDREWKSQILDKPEIWGIESLSAQALVVRLVVRTRASQQFAVARELRLRLKHALDASGVSLPPLERVVVERMNDEGKGAAAAQAVLAAQARVAQAAKGSK